MRRAPLVVVALAAALLASIAPAGAVGSPPFAQPVWDRSYPDPFVLHVGTTWYAYATDGDLGEVQLISSPDLVTWGSVGNALGDPPSWAQPNDVWAPTVLNTGSGFVLWASFVDTASGKRCIGKATSTNAVGPFDRVDAFKLCDAARGGVIDSATYTAGGTTYLLWKTEGVPGNDAEPPSIFSQPLTSTQTLTGASARIFKSREPWEGTLAENPSMVSDGGRLYLFYSGNEWESASYGVGWALCSAPQGTCIAPPNRPLLTSTSDARGPGGGTVFKDENGAWWLGFAAWLPGGGVTEATGQRGLFFRRLQFTGGRPNLATADGSFAEPAFTQRVAGVNRYDTAVAFSQNTVQADRPITYVATGATYVDALIAAPASGFEHSPVLLVERDGIPQSVRDELGRLHPGHIVVMGGTDAISDAVYGGLSPYSDGSIHREAGVNQYHRSALVSRNTFDDPNVPVVYIATGQAFPDGLAGGAAAAANSGPLLFVEQNGIPVDVRTELDRLNPGRIVVLGGPAAVSHEVLAQLAQYSSRVDRVAGNDRYETAAALATSQFAKVNGSVAAVVIATGQNFPDAVAAGAAGLPVLLVPSTGSAPQVVKDALVALNPLGVIVMGGTGAVSQATLASLGL